MLDAIIVKHEGRTERRSYLIVNSRSQECKRHELRAMVAINCMLIFGCIAIHYLVLC